MKSGHLLTGKVDRGILREVGGGVGKGGGILEESLRGWGAGYIRRKSNMHSDQNCVLREYNKFVYDP